ncbi:septum formation initiator family protein [Paenibacillus sp. MWE-103]|uniref:Septum formation initiator family protein n=1 Tax=Paenibacillus artemisiicola TaxID=1172618 RepID=A0ABS3WKZ3_9BACL|nr:MULTISPECIES: septum formation initiator family protein [Paenibacillus]MBO7748988.1 septum formation initiator family protein [Paenibacillus artemisiicola]SFJ87023.1 cell division protein DivIC [Paenibacillus sp. UNC496MF]
MATASSNSAPNRAGTKRRLKLWLFFVVLFMGWALYTGITQMGRQGQAEDKLAAAKQKIDEATKQTEDLKLELKRLNDPEYIGLKATQEFGMVKKGEKQIDVVPKP